MKIFDHETLELYGITNLKYANNQLAIITMHQAEYCGCSRGDVNDR